MGFSPRLVAFRYKMARLDTALCFPPTRLRWFNSANTRAKSKNQMNRLGEFLRGAQGQMFGGQSRRSEASVFVRCKTLACLVFFACSELFLAATEFEVKGNLIIRKVDKAQDNLTLRLTEQSFSMSVQDCRWMLTKVPTKFIKLGELQQLQDFISASSDLTNFYYLVSMEGIANTLVSSGKSHPKNTCSGIIGNGIVPYGVEPTIGILWYAFASECYFLNKPKDEYLHGVIPFRNVGYYSKDSRSKASWKLGSTVPSLPEFIAFSGEYKFLNEEPDPDFSEIQNPTNCIYSVVEFTNVGGLRLPRRALAQFPNPSSVETTIEFTVNEVIDHCNITNFAISIPGNAALSDYRPISNPMFLAVATGITREWPDAKVSKQKYERLLQKKLESASNNKNASVRLSVLIVLGLTAVASLLLLFLNKQNPNTKH